MTYQDIMGDVRSIIHEHPLDMDALAEMLEDAPPEARGYALRVAGFHRERWLEVRGLYQHEKPWSEEALKEAPKSLAPLLRYFACDCARRAMRRVGWDDERSWRAVEVAEEYAKGDATLNELTKARADARTVALATNSGAILSRETEFMSVSEAAWSALWATWAARDAEWVAVTAARAARDSKSGEERRCQAEDIRYRLMEYVRTGRQW